jgi:putative hydrolase
VDTSRIEEIAQQIDPSNPSSIEEAMSSGLFEQQTTDEQRVALERLETLLALIEGWVDVVVAQAVGDRLPGAGALRETLRRRRASGGPAEQTFATLVGLQLRPRRLRDAATVWAAMGQQHGSTARDRLWNHPDLLPTSDDLDEPMDFVGRQGMDDELAALTGGDAGEGIGEAPQHGAAEQEDDADGEEPDARG